jgi:hypothetical protein
LVQYIEDGRPTIHNAPAEQTLRPLALGRCNGVPIARDGGLKRAAVRLRLAARAKRHAVN